MKSLLKSLPYIGGLHREIGALKEELARRRTWMPPGHFYSPIHSLEDVARDAERIFRVPAEGIPAVDLNDARQLALVDEFARFHAELPIDWQTAGRARYCYDNEYYSYADGIALYSMLRQLAPRRLIEVGSGFSSAVALDTIERFLPEPVHCTFIEPYPERLLGLLGEADRQRCTLRVEPVQQVPLAVFEELGPGDILLIDSSHVSKVGSDLNYLLFEVVPRLASGVYVHFHDVFYPFEYPRRWIEEGVAWNEAYLLRAFLQYNGQFSIEFFTSYLLQVHQARIEQQLPMMLRSERPNPGLRDCPGSSLWLRRGP